MERLWNAARRDVRAASPRAESYAAVDAEARVGAAPAGAAGVTALVALLSFTAAGGLLAATQPAKPSCFSWGLAVRARRFGDAERTFAKSPASRQRARMRGRTSERLRGGERHRRRGGRWQRALRLEPLASA